MPKKKSRAENAQKRADGADDDAEDDRQAKRFKQQSIGTKIADELVCPISHNLPIDPVTAEDGQVYEREDIEAYIRSRGRKRMVSPVTQKKMAKKVFPSVRIRNTIEHLVNSGAIEGELAETWKNRSAVADLKKKAEEGDAAAMHALGDWYLDGEKDLPKDEEEACKWYEKASENGDELAKKKAKNINDRRAVRVMMERAEKGDAEAMYQMGIFYEEGVHGLEEDEEEKFQWFMKAANAGHAAGMALAGCYMAGAWDACSVAPTDVPEGFHLLRKAAEKGSGFACLCLGEMYYGGLLGTEKNYAKAKKWLEKIDDCEHRRLNESDRKVARAWLHYCRYFTTDNTSPIDSSISGVLYCENDGTIYDSTL